MVFGNLIKRLLMYYGLMLVGIILMGRYIISPDEFILRYVDSFFLLFVSLLILLNFQYRIAKGEKCRGYILGITVSFVILALLRGAGSSIFTDVLKISRYVHYFVYIPILLIPQMFLFAAAEAGEYSRVWLYLTLFVTGVFIALIVTNDFHQLVFIFPENYQNWNLAYTVGPGFIMMRAWAYVLYVLGIILLITDCRITSVRKYFFIIFLPLIIGIVLDALAESGILPTVDGVSMIETPEITVYMVACLLECCMQLGLIPVNEEYKDIIRISTDSTQIWDNEGKIRYLADSATPLTAEQAALEDYSLIGPDTLLRKMAVPGGYAYWTENIAEINRLNGELTATKNQLEDELEVLRLDTDLKQKYATIEHRNKLYDEINKGTAEQSLNIAALAAQGMNSGDEKLRENCRRHIVLLASYLKRYANLMLLTDESSVLNAGELGLAINEYLHYLEYYGIKNGAEIDVKGGKMEGSLALAVFEGFMTLIESNLSSLLGTIVSLKLGEDAYRLKVCLELRKEPATLPFSRLLKLKVNVRTDREDDSVYYTFLIPMAGKEDPV